MEWWCLWKALWFMVLITCRREKSSVFKIIEITVFSRALVLITWRSLWGSRKASKASVSIRCWFKSQLRCWLVSGTEDKSPNCFVWSGVSTRLRVAPKSKWGDLRCTPTAIIGVSRYSLPSSPFPCSRIMNFIVLDQGFSKCGPQTSSSSCELVRIVSSWVQPRPPGIRDWGGGPVICISAYSLQDSDALV